MMLFDLERAKKGVPMRTRTGRKAEFVCLLSGGQPAPLVVDLWRRESNPKNYGGEFVDIKSKNGKPENYYINGRFNDVHDSELDLFMEY